MSEVVACNNTHVKKILCRMLNENVKSTWDDDYNDETYHDSYHDYVDETYHDTYNDISYSDNW